MKYLKNKEGPDWKFCAYGHDCDGFDPAELKKWMAGKILKADSVFTVMNRMFL